MAHIINKFDKLAFIYSCSHSFRFFYYSFGGSSLWVFISYFQTFFLAYEMDVFDTPGEKLLQYVWLIHCKFIQAISLELYIHVNVHNTKYSKTCKRT